MNTGTYTRPDKTGSKSALKIVGGYTVAATAAGAVPLPIASKAIVIDNGFMITHIAAVMKEPITISAVCQSIGLAEVLNIACRSLFIDGAKALGWGTLNWWAPIALSGFGAATAGVQTFTIGLIAIEIGRNGGNVIGRGKVSEIIDYGKMNFKSFIAEMEEKTSSFGVSVNTACGNSGIGRG